MTVFLMSTLIFGLSVAAMGIGVIWGRGPLGGGCSGSAVDCAVCTRTCRRPSDGQEP
jgi:hypothetical protein